MPIMRAQAKIGTTGNIGGKGKKGKRREGTVIYWMKIAVLRGILCVGREEGP